MKIDADSNFLYSSYWYGWRRVVVWVVSVGFVILLGLLRTETDAELAFASLVVFPVLIIAWIGGRSNGLVMAFIGAMMWGVADAATKNHFSAAWIPWANAATRLSIYSLIAFQTALIREQFDREHEHAIADVLTGLKNRREFLRVGALEIERSKRYGHSLAIIFLDLDNFKLLNDTRGHNVGDAALRITANTLVKTLRSNDLVARLGGDEFSVLISEVGYAEANQAGHKISADVNHALRELPPVTASVGLVWFETVDRPFQSMIDAADVLMYDVKKSGKGSIRAQRFATFSV